MLFFAAILEDLASRAAQNPESIRTIALNLPEMLQGKMIRILFSVDRHDYKSSIQAVGCNNTSL
jgi:hypothetical protein